MNKIIFFFCIEIQICEEKKQRELFRLFTLTSACSLAVCMQICPHGAVVATVHYEVAARVRQKVDFIFLSVEDSVSSMKIV